MHNFLRYLENTCISLAVISSFSMMCLTAGDAFGRYIFNSPIAGAYEITESYLMIVSCFLGACYAYREGMYVRVTFFIEKMPQRVRLVLNYFAQLFVCVLNVALLIAATKTTVTIFVKGERLYVFGGIPLWPAYVVVALGFFFMSLRMVLDLPLVKDEKSSLFK